MHLYAQHQRRGCSYLQVSSEMGRIGIGDPLTQKLECYQMLASLEDGGVMKSSSLLIMASPLYQQVSSEMGRIGIRDPLIQKLKCHQMLASLEVGVAIKSSSLHTTAGPLPRKRQDQAGSGIPLENSLDGLSLNQK
jgi:Rod binding domain-containing protein